jgi:ATP-dependent protease ClpP protease subunit
MEIIIDGVIGWDFYASDFRNKLKEANGQNLEIQISSPGGSVYEGNTIYDLILKYKNDFPNSRIIITSFGISASMASIIALAGDVHIVFSNTTYVIHNTWTLEIGDKNAMRKTADVLESLDNIVSKVYNKKSGKSIKEIKSLMDKETYFFGQEILDNGFADKIIQAEESLDKKEKGVLAKLAIAETIDKMKNEKDYDFYTDCKKAVALFKTDENKEDKQKEKESIAVKTDKNIKMEVKRMTPEELKEKFPDTYNAIIKMGKDEEYERVKSHIIMGKGAGNINMAIKNIEERNNFSSSISAEYMAEGMKGKEIQKRKNDNVDTGSTAGDDDEAEKEAHKKRLLESRRVK